VDGAVLGTIVLVSVLVFVVSSMLAMGLSLTMGEVIEPLRDIRLLAIALAVNFIAVPLVAVLIGNLLSLDDGLYIGLILMATAAGAPFLPKLAQAAKGDIAYSVGLMVLLMVVTVVYMPIVMPLILEDVEVSPWDIASSLIFLMLLPLAIGLFVKARYESAADGLQPVMAQTSTIAIAIMLVAGLIMNFEEIVDIIGTGGIAAIVLFLAAGFALGYFGGGGEPGIKSVLGRGTAHRNLSAALVVAGQNFTADPDVITFIIVAGLVGLVILMPAAGEIGKRAEAKSSAA